MHIATLTSSGLSDRAITYQDGTFFLQDHGALPVDTVLAFDAQGRLQWVQEDYRVWVRSFSVAARPSSRSSGLGSIGRFASDHLLVLVVLIAGAGAIALILAVAGVFESEQPGQTAATTPDVMASWSPAAGDAPTSWPALLSGSWGPPDGNASTVRVVISESADAAKISEVYPDGTVLYWVFSGETLTYTDDDPDTFDLGPFGRTVPGPSPLTGSYTWDHTGLYGDPVVTAQVTFVGRTLTINVGNTGNLPGVTIYESWSIAGDGQTLTITLSRGSLASSSATLVRE